MRESAQHRACTEGSVCTSNRYQVAKSLSLMFSHDTLYSSQTKVIKISQQQTLSHFYGYHGQCRCFDPKYSLAAFLLLILVIKCFKTPVHSWNAHFHFFFPCHHTFIQLYLSPYDTTLCLSLSLTRLLWM